MGLRIECEVELSGVAWSNFVLVLTPRVNVFTMTIFTTVSTSVDSSDKFTAVDEITINTPKLEMV